MLRHQSPMDRNSRLSEDQLQKFQKALFSENEELCIKLIQEYPINYKSLSQIRGIISTMSPQKAYDWGNKLLEHDVVHKIIACIFLEHTKIWDINIEKTKQIIIEFSQKNDWRMRRAAITLLRKSIASSFDNFKEILIDFIKSDSPFYRRVAVSTAKDISTLSTKQMSLKKSILYLIEEIIYEKNPYVITVANDTLANGFLRYCPEITNKWVLSKINEVKDNHAIKSLISIYSTQTVGENIDHALQIIDYFIEHDIDMIKHARAACLREIAKSNPDKLSSWLESRLDNQHIVDHWAKLESEGLLSLDFY